MRLNSGFLFWCALLLSPSLGYAANALLPEPSGVTLAQGRLVALSSDRHVWVRDLKPGDDWRVVVVDPAAPGHQPDVNFVTCAQDDSGFCAIAFAQIDQDRIGLLDLETRKLRPISLYNASPLFYAQKGRLYYSRSYGLSNRYFYIDTDNMQSTSIIEINTPNPIQLKTIMTAGIEMPVLFNNFKVAVLTAPGKIVTLPQPPGGYIVTLNGILKWEPFVFSTPNTPGRRAMTNLNLDVNGDTIRLVDPFIASLDEKRQPLPGSLVSDAAEDLMAISSDVAVSPDSASKSINVFCHDGAGKLVLKPLLRLSEFQTGILSATRASDGFVLETHDAQHSAKFSVLRLSAAGRGWSQRQCANTTLDIVDPNIQSEDSLQNFKRDVRRATSADGVGVDYELISPRSSPVTSVILDVYGAYGNQRDFPYLHAGTQNYVTDQHLVMGYAIVRGDGDRGYDYAAASAAPNRRLAVDDVTAVALDLIKLHPEFRGHITLRGQSAGAWLAVRAALARPDLFSGAISISGLYEIRKSHDLHLPTPFFSESDDLLSALSDIKAGCNGQHFRIVHALDDELAPANLATDFEQALEAKGCSAEMVTFASGGHDLNIKPSDAERRLRAYFQPF